MGFKALLGNARLKENLAGAIRQGRISHFYLLSGPEGSGKHTLATLLSAAAMCKEQEKPCLRCPACRKVLANTHPDVLTVVDPEHKTVPVKVIREAREGVFVRPNEGDRKVYIFPQEMGIEGQNALLKILEEPPSYGMFLLLTDNPEKLLPTIRSRCTELSLLPLSAEELKKELTRLYPDASQETILSVLLRSGGYLGQAKALMDSGAAVSQQTDAFRDCFSSRNAADLALLLCSMEKWKRDAFVQELTQWATLLQNALVCRGRKQADTLSGISSFTSRSARELMTAYNEIQKAITYAQGNVSVAALCGHLLWVLR